MNWSKRDSKTFWKTLDKLEQKKSFNPSKLEISPNKWMGHFKNLLNNQNDFTPLPGNTKERGPLDHDVTNSEIALDRTYLGLGYPRGMIEYQMK